MPSACASSRFVQPSAFWRMKVSWSEDKPVEGLAGQLFAHVLALEILAGVFDLGERARFVVIGAHGLVVRNALGVALAEFH